MSVGVAVGVLVGYFALIMLVSWLVARNDDTNSSFFVANRRSPWWMVTLGMIGASVSGVSFVSVPGMVMGSQFTYLQMVMGFFFGYLLVAYVLLPLYYKMGLTTIYGYLQSRFGRHTYRSAALLFVVAKMVGAASKLYVVALVLHYFVFAAIGLPFYFSVLLLVVLIWIYTHRGGVRSLIFTDCIQTFVLVAALVFIIVDLVGCIGMPWGELCRELMERSEARVFVFDDWVSQRNFFKQFLSGVFVVVVMTGLDQDMMQKNLTCRSLRDSQRNMLVGGALFLPLNFLFLLLGLLILFFAEQYQLTVPAAGDKLLPWVVTSHLGCVSYLLFLLGMVAASLSSADSALTSITTSLYVDVFGCEPSDSKRGVALRKAMHAVVCALFFAVVVLFESLQNSSILDFIYTMVGYLYGPLLGWFVFGIFTKRRVHDAAVPYIAVLSPLLCYALNAAAKHCFSYSFGYELLMINGMLTFVGMLIVSRRKEQWR